MGYNANLGLGTKIKSKCPGAPEGFDSSTVIRSAVSFFGKAREDELGVEDQIYARARSRNISKEKERGTTRSRFVSLAG